MRDETIFVALGPLGVDTLKFELSVVLNKYSLGDLFGVAATLRDDLDDVVLRRQVQVSIFAFADFFEGAGTGCRENVARFEKDHTETKN